MLLAVLWPLKSPNSSYNLQVQKFSLFFFTRVLLKVSFETKVSQQGYGKSIPTIHKNVNQLGNVCLEYIQCHDTILGTIE